MENLLIACILMTPAIFLFGVGLIYEPRAQFQTQEKLWTAVISIVMFVFPLWATFFIIRSLN